jgi:hypothetical protein
MEPVVFMEVVISGKDRNLNLNLRCDLISMNSSLAILYSCFSVTNILAPAIVSIMGSSLSMFLGGTTYL